MDDGKLVGIAESIKFVFREHLFVIFARSASTLAHKISKKGLQNSSLFSKLFLS